MSDLFDSLLPESTQKLNVQNTFSISDNQDKQIILKNPSKYNMFDDMLSDSTKNFS